MTLDPRTEDTIYNSLKSSLTGKITKLTNFTDRSFNYVWTRAFSTEIRELETRALVSQLAGWIDYSGGPISEDDLSNLGVSNVSASDVNDLMDESYLDEYVKLVGITRDPGSKATGEIDINTQSAKTDIPSGTVVTTRPDIDGTTLDFQTTEDASTGSNETLVQNVPIEALDVGTEYNLPADKVVRFDDPPTGVKGIESSTSTTGGEDRETNDELRTRAKNAVQASSGGGTAAGIRGYIRQNVDPVGEGDVAIDEFTDPCPPYVDVIVDGGTDSNVQTAIDESRPVGIRHNLVRPAVINIAVQPDVLGESASISNSTVESDISDFLSNLGIDETMYNTQLIRTIIDADSDILNIDQLNAIIESVDHETFTYSSGTTDYRLRYTFESSNGSITITDENGKTYTQGVDYSVNDQTGDGYPETIVWDTNNDVPSDGTTFFVDYDVTVLGSTSQSDYYYTRDFRDEIFTFKSTKDETFTYQPDKQEYFLAEVPFDGTSSITDSSGDTFSEGTDYDINDNTGNGFKQTLDWGSVEMDGAVADDGGTTTDETSEANSLTEDDMTLLPSSPAVGDAYYFGWNDTFEGLQIDISTGGSGTWDIVWEYYDGGSWVALSGVTDNTNDFRNDSKQEVTWTVPGNWSTTSVGGISGLYWVRARLDTFSSISTQPLGKKSIVKPENRPDDNEDFTITYEQKVYRTSQEIVDTPNNQITDSSGDTYDEGSEYQLVDYSSDNEDDAIEWLTNPASLNDDEEFYFTYFTEGDVPVSVREKVSDGSINITVV